MTSFINTLTDGDWQLIGDGILRGRYNLLLGAGVSLDSMSGVPGENCPSASKLQELLLKLKPNLKSNSSMNRIYRTLDVDQIDINTTKRFSGCVPGETANVISNFRWRRIFTLNVDDALESAYEQNIIQVQKPESINFSDPFREIRDIREIPIVHLHGFSRIPEDGYIFDISEYMKSIRDSNIWAHILGQIIRTEPFIVIGTSLEEPDISYFLSDRSHTKFRADKPPSLFIEPSPDEGTEFDCSEYMLKLFKGTALEFFDQVGSRYPDRPSVDEAIEDNLGHEIVASKVNTRFIAEFHSDFEKVPQDQVAGPDGGPLFALGHAASWADIQNGRDVYRDNMDNILSDILRSPAGKAWLISGEAGSGKSTILRRLAWNLSQGGRCCFWLRSVGRLRNDAANEIIRSISERVYIFVDNFADNVIEISMLKNTLKDRDIVIVGADRIYRRDHIKRIYGNENIEDKFIESIGERTAIDLKESYKKYGLLTKTDSKSTYHPLEKEVIAVACCRILNDFEPLATILSKSVSDASPDDKKCYLFTALAAHCYRQGVEYDIASAQFPNYHVDIQVEDRGPLPLKVTEISGIEFVTPLNEAFSDSILRRLSLDDADSMAEAFLKLAKAIRPRVSNKAIVDGEPCARIASRLFDFDDVVKRFLGLDGAESFFEKTENEWSWNSRYWHQVAHLRLDLAEVESDLEKKLLLANLAVQHARFSRTIEEHHQFTHTTIGRTLFGKFEVMGACDPNDLAEAISALERAISIEQKKRRTTVHPYMILFDGLERELARGAILSPDQRKAVRSRINESRGRFPKDADLREKGNRLLAVI